MATFTSGSRRGWGCDSSALLDVTLRGVVLRDPGGRACQNGEDQRHANTDHPLPNLREAHASLSGFLIGCIYPCTQLRLGPFYE